MTAADFAAARQRLGLTRHQRARRDALQGEPRGGGVAPGRFDSMPRRDVGE